MKKSNYTFQTIIFLMIAVVIYIVIWSFIIHPFLAWKPNIYEKIILIFIIYGIIKIFQEANNKVKIRKAVENGIYFKTIYGEESYLVKDLGNDEYEMTRIDIQINTEKKKYICVVKRGAEPQIVSGKHLINLVSNEGYHFYKQGFIKSCLSNNEE